jgi:TonB family protein
MSQRALLFSSDPETSRRLAQALRELEFSVDHCPEIFAAVERITSHSFELIVTDWDDGVEAMFLIKTARELRLNCDAFRIVAAKPGAANAAQQAGAQIVVPKPILPGHTKYALLTSDQFVKRMKNWVPVLAEPIAPPAVRVPVSPVAETVVEKPWAPQSLAMEDDNLNLSFGSLERNDSFLDKLGIQFDSVQAMMKPRLRVFMWGALLLGAVSTGYVFSGTFRAQAASRLVPSAMRLSLSAGAATAPAPPSHQSKLTIRVMPKAEPRTEAVVEPAVISEDPVRQEAVARVPERPSIPASLSAPMETAIGARASEAKSAPPLMSGVEPVSLTEDLSEKMLLSRVMPDYPMRALQSKLQGAVLLQAWIRKDGTVRDLKVVNGPFVLCEAAYNAVKQWRYKPLQMNGQSVEATTYVTVNFRLP